MYAEHIARICKIEDIEINYVAWGGGRAWHRKRRIRTRHVKSDITYALALHEIGHILEPKAHNGTRLDKEVAAWLWAMANAKEWTDKMDAYMRKCLRSYLAWSKRHKTAKEADASHPIHNLV